MLRIRSIRISASAIPAAMRSKGVPAPAAELTTLLQGSGRNDGRIHSSGRNSSVKTWSPKSVQKSSAAASGEDARARSGCGCGGRSGCMVCSGVQAIYPRKYMVLTYLMSEGGISYPPKQQPTFGSCDVHVLSVHGRQLAIAERPLGKA